ncbi:hypothetical protein [Pseudarthrobacter sp. NPDC058119]|uniref:hypothetical protein n=1 Tax=Pseudarthrobacter sp. NPDC058119 TaxID=3346348 RepID=UPI0036DFA169
MHLPLTSTRLQTNSRASARRLEVGTAYFSDGNTRSYSDLLLENISAASLLFSQPLDSTATAAAEGNA